jgi:hypothetical protein
VEKERQRASSRVQQLQTELSSMRTQQDGLRKRLQDRLVVQEKAAAAKAREMSALRRAGELDSTPASQSFSELGRAHDIQRPICAPGAEGQAHGKREQLRPAEALQAYSSCYAY